MGGGRDVGDAPHPSAYGFDETFTSFNGLGDRVLWSDKLSQMSEQLGQGKIIHGTKSETSDMFVNRSIDFVKRHRDRPLLTAVAERRSRSVRPQARVDGEVQEILPERVSSGVLRCARETDRHIGRLIDAVDQEGLAYDTLIVFIGNNGPTAWPHYYKEGIEPPGSTRGLRGRKWCLYEGGIREPLIVRQPGRIPAGRVDRDSVICTVDFFPTFCKMQE